MQHLTSTRVTLPGLEGSYEAYVAPGRDCSPLFTLDTTRKIAAETQKVAAASRDPRSAETIHVLEAAPAAAGQRAAIVVHVDWCAQTDGDADAARIVTPNGNGLYPLGTDWQWAPVACRQ
ncbi:hypothetical protein [Streptomyces sp. NBC_00425]|uniref:hypothetical protein n=1 Tax=Streptomyces sp. NBC_00425 TaxID=2975740 RepID=UPI002E1D99AE